jgi:hypothetical protein
VRAAHDEAELAQAFEALTDPEAEALVIQRLISGRIGNSIALFDKGVPLCWTSAFKARTFPGAFGPSSARKYMSHPDVEPMLTRFGAGTRYHGFAAFDWVLDDATGRLAVIELNSRAVPTIHLSRFAGVDFARSIRDLLAGRAHVQRPPDLPASTPVIAMFPEDFYRASSEPKAPKLEDRELRYRDIPWTDWPLIAYHVRATWKAWKALQAERRSTPRLPA